MIIFSPAYDEVTKAGYAIVQQICRQSDVVLGGNSATCQALVQVLKSKVALPLFLMSHGEPDRVKATAEESALDLTNIATFPARPIFAQACFSARELGKTAGKHGHLWWGYNIAATSPPEAPTSVLAVFVSLFRFILINFSAAKTPSQIQGFFADLFQECNRAYEALDSLKIAAACDYHCVRDIQNSLVVWGDWEKPVVPNHRPESTPDFF